MNDREFELSLPLPLALDGHAGPATRIGRDRAAAMVEAAMLAYDGAAAPPPTRSARGRVWGLAAGSLLAVVAGVAAARYYYVGQRAANDPAPVPARRVVATPHSPEPMPEVVDEPSAEPLALPAAEKRLQPTNLERSAPEDLLQRANRLRAAGQFRQAAQTYQQVYEHYPRSTLAYVARVAAASIELEHLSNPTRARRLFEQALSAQPHGALDLEARQGLGTALRDLEDRRAEVRVLESLVNAHPDSPAARRAQVRLHEIAGDSP